ncbi:MAG: tRNA lysidine(34) synthetase TilS [Planctomycetota bacterium]
MWPTERHGGVGVLVGCSGGADSVALLRALHAIRQPMSVSGATCGELVVAHYNHRLRGAESDADADFVRALADDLEIRCVIESGRVTENGPTQASSEESLRDVRYQSLQRIGQRLGTRYLAVAHSADDNVETLLHHLLRGTGPRGLTAIPPFRDLGDELVLARPLLQVRRDTIRRALREIGQSWREDSSNQQTDYSRNWIRQTLLPLIHSRYPAADEAILRLIDSQSKWRETIDDQARRWIKERVAIHPPNRVTIHLIDDTTTQATVIAALQAVWDRIDWPRGVMRADRWTELARLIRDSEPPVLANQRTDDGSVHATQLPGGIQIHRSGDTLTLRRLTTRDATAPKSTIQ